VTEPGGEVRLHDGVEITSLDQAAHETPPCPHCWGHDCDETCGVVTLSADSTLAELAVVLRDRRLRVRLVGMGDDLLTLLQSLGIVA